MKTGNYFEKLATKITCWTGSSAAFLISISVVLVWVVTGPMFHFSDTWQLVINTGTSVVTFLMVFLIQKSQNKDFKALQLKLNELIAANRRTSNRMVDVEDLDEKELDHLRKFYARLSKLAEQEEDIHTSHSIDRAEEIQEKKQYLNGSTDGLEDDNSN